MERWKTISRIVLLKVMPLVVGLVALVAVIAFVAGTFTPKIAPTRRDAAERQLEGLPTETVHRVPKDYMFEAVGKLGAADRTIMSAKILATIEEITVNAGDEVQPGQLLVRLSSDEFQSRLQQAQQALAGQKSNLVEASSAYQRAEQLIRSGRGTITKGDYDQTVARFQMAQSEVRRYEQAVEEAKVLLSYAEITAHKAGRIVKRLAEPGDTAAPGQPLLEIYDARSLRLEAPVPESLAVKLKPGDPLTVYIDALNLELEGEVDEIVPQADVLSRSLLVKVALPESENLYEGLSGRLSIPTGRRYHLCLAESAIRQIGQLEFVDVVRSDDTLERRLIKTGRVGMPGRVEVLSGVSAGERVVIREEAAPPNEQEGGPGR